MQESSESHPQTIPPLDQNMHESPIAGGAGRYRAEHDSVFPPHVHRDWEFVYYTRGRAVVSQAGSEIHAMAGTLITTPPGVPHHEYAETAYANIYLQVFADASTPWPTVVHDDPAGGIGRVFESLIHEDSSATEMRGLLFNQLVILIDRASSAPFRSGPTNLVLAAERRMRDGISERLSLSELARDLGVAPSTLRLAFLHERDMPPRERYAEIRMQLVLAHLRRSTMTVEHIAHVTGFASASHLSRTVKQATGLSPRELRLDQLG